MDGARRFGLEPHEAVQVFSFFVQQIGQFRDQFHADLPDVDRAALETLVARRMSDPAFADFWDSAEAPMEQSFRDFMNQQRST